jgi:chromosome partitioning protein
MIITVSSLKGGVGKTTIAAFLAQALAARGMRVLVVDLDHNNNLTDYCLRNYEAEDIDARNIRHVLNGSVKIDSAIWLGMQPEGDARALDIIPATPSLATVGLEMARDPAGVLRLRSGLRRLDYDHVIVDTPPALTLELTAGLYAADLVLVPVSASRWTVQGYQVIEGEVSRVEDAGLAVPRMLAVPSMVSEVEAASIREVPIWRATAASIRRDPSIRSAASEGRALRDGTHGAEWFAALAAEVVG